MVKDAEANQADDIKRKDAVEAKNNAESLVYQTVEGMVAATGLPAEQFCLACFNDQYPTPLPAEFEIRRANVRRHQDASNDPV